MGYWVRMGSADMLTLTGSLDDTAHPGEGIIRRPVLEGTEHAEVQVQYSGTGEMDTPQNDMIVIAPPLPRGNGLMPMGYNAGSISHLLILTMTISGAISVIAVSSTWRRRKKLCQ